MDKEQLERDLIAGLSIRKIANKHGYSYSNTRHWIKRHGLDKLKRRNFHSYDESQFIIAVAENVSIAGVLRYIGRAHTGSNYIWVKRESQRLKLDTSHWTGRSHGKNLPEIIPWSEILVINSKFRIGVSRKIRLVRDGYLDNKCAICGIGNKWNDLPLILILDHINGSHFDNRIENLRLVCPNCNSQLPTHCGKNKKPT